MYGTLGVPQTGALNAFVLMSVNSAAANGMTLGVRRL
jgi:hypothetical protein